MTHPIRILLFSTLYPSAVRPSHGIFVETRLRELIKTGEVETRVVAPVPWFPLRSRIFGTYGKMAATPQYEVRNGIEVHHPRYLLPPKVGMAIAPNMLAQGALPTVRRLIAEGFDFDLLDAHYYYPDGVAAAKIARVLRKPFVVTARGTDLNLIANYAGPRRRILATAAQAAASIGVSHALIERLSDLGADRDKLHVLRNGVDSDRFRPIARDVAYQRLGFDSVAQSAGKIILSVGNLIERKGHHIAVEALTLLPPASRLVIVGEGGLRRALVRQAQELGVDDRVTFAGAVPQTELKYWYSAADVLVLCSSSEGWANVLLEAMACGTPVVATNVGGNAEVVSKPEAGCLMRERSATALVQSLVRLFADYPEREAVRRYALDFSWQATTQGQLDLFRKILDGRADEDVSKDIQ